MLKSVRRRELFACRQASTCKQLLSLHECLRRSILPNSVNHRLPINYPQGWMIARQIGGRMVRMLITDAHNCLNKYRRIVILTRYLCKQVTDNEATAEIETSLSYMLEIVRKGKDYHYMRSQKDPKEMGNRTRVNNLSSRPV